MTDIEPLEAFLKRTPCVQFASGKLESEYWWVKFGINIDHPLAWRTVQELGHVLNYLSLNERLPTVFKPVSPPPYLNGGPAEHLSWVIECHDMAFSPRQCAEWLEGRLPQPVEDASAWVMDEEQ